MFTVRNVIDRAKFILNDEQGYSLGIFGNDYSNILPVVSVVVNKVIKSFGLRKRIGYIKLFKYSQNYFTVNRYTSLVNSFMPYHCQIPETMLGIKEVITLPNRTIIPFTKEILPVSSQSSSNIMVWNCDIGRLTFYPKYGNDVSPLEGIFNNNDNSFLFNSAVNVSLPYVLLVFTKDSYQLFFYKVLVYSISEITNEGKTILKSPEVLYLNSDAILGTSFECYTPDIAYMYSEALNITSINDVIDFEDDFIDYIAYSIVAGVFERMRLYQDAQYFEIRARDEYKRLINEKYSPDVYYLSSDMRGKIFKI